ncbi:hypothetical protein NHN26_07385 [Rhodovulum tesquicola]|uniref:hypothetical protein n=1 Tax=Rhodovulum tesquicola TaxID=540254 RepID=UPI0020980CC7|nr:hypothetical protein [Rhodovulum tesquicola]MCO8145046.1 hypothetical protein [Rhodovulum tesquicola]
MAGSEFDDPIEVWLAAAGDPVPLADLLSGDAPLSRRARDALAAWLTGAFDAEPGPEDDAPAAPLTPARIKLTQAAAEVLRVTDWAEARGIEIDRESLSREVAAAGEVAPELLNAMVRRMRRDGRQDARMIEARAYRQWRARNRPHGPGR